MPRFSIVMPTKDRHLLISEAVVGIMSQDFQDWELLIEDGGKSVEHLLPKDPRIKYCRQIDPLDRRGNFALMHAQGEILSYHADDDVLTEGALSAVDSAIGNRRWLYGLIHYGPTNSPAMNPRWGSEWHYGRLKRENFVPAPAAYWTREARDIVGGWDVDNPRSHDWDMWLRLGARWEPLFLRKTLAWYRIHPQSETEKMPEEYKQQMDDVVRERARAGYYDV